MRFVAAVVYVDVVDVLSQLFLQLFVGLLDDSDDKFVSCAD